MKHFFCVNLVVDLHIYIYRVCRKLKIEFLKKKKNENQIESDYFNQSFDDVV